MLLMLLGLVIARLIQLSNVIGIAHMGVIFLDRIVENPVLFFLPIRTLFDFKSQLHTWIGQAKSIFNFIFKKSHNTPPIQFIFLYSLKISLFEFNHFFSTPPIFGSPRACVATSFCVHWQSLNFFTPSDRKQKTSPGSWYCATCTKNFFIFVHSAYCILW